MPSLATVISWKVIPFFLQIGASSSSLIGREASEMSVSPAQNFSKPPPVPEVPTEIWTSGFCPWNCSAAVWDEPYRKSDRSVDVYVAKLRHKLDEALPGTRFIHTHFGFGYRLEQEPLSKGSLHRFHIPETSPLQTGY